jgi:phage terminase large subunit
MKKSRLLQQAEAELAKERFAKINLVRDAKVDRIKAIKKLLPKYDIQAKPRKFHESHKPDKWLIGGYGSGKTYTFCAEAIFLCWVNAPVPVLLITQTKGNSKATTLKTLIEMLDKNGLMYDKSSD